MISNFVSAQKTLEIYKFRFGKYKKFELYCGDKVSYKLNDQGKFHSGVITNMSDSLLLIDDEKIIRIDHIKALRFNRGGNILHSVSLLFAKAAVILIYVNLAANIVYDKAIMVDRRITYLSAALGVTYLIFEVWNTKRVRINGSVRIKVFDPHYQRINAL